MSKSDDEVGVLLVHGIGSSKQGDTLSKWAKALLDCLIDKGSTVIGLESSLKAGAGQAQIRSLVIPKDGSTPFRLRIAEAWWAEAFTPPSFISILWWSFLAFPWTAVSHADDRFRRTGNRLEEAWAELRKIRRFKQLLIVLVHIVDVVIEMIWLFFGLLLAPVLLVVFLLIGILAWIPWRPIRAFVSTLLRVLSGTIGDSYVFVENIVIRHAITNRITSSLKALMDASEKQIIVAHSQGAAVTYNALENLRQRDDDVASRIRQQGIHRFITFGSGLRKLRSLADRTHRNSSIVLALIAMIFAIGAAGVMWVVRLEQSADHLLEPSYRISLVVSTIVFPFILNLLGLTVRTIGEALVRKLFGNYTIVHSSLLNLIGLAVIVILGYWLWKNPGFPGFSESSFWMASCMAFSFTSLMFWRYAAGRASDKYGQNKIEIAEWHDLNLDFVEHWDDVYAGLDPVPNGPLLEEYSVASKFTPNEISNMSNIFLDHTSYWGNQQQFVAPIVDIILGTSKTISSGDKSDYIRSEFSSVATKLSDPTRLIFRLLNVALLVVIPLSIYWRYGDPALLFNLDPLKASLWSSIREVATWREQFLVALSWASWGLFGAILLIIHFVLGIIESRLSRKSSGQR